MSKTSQRKLAHSQNKAKWFKVGYDHGTDKIVAPRFIPRKYWKDFNKGWDLAIKEFQSKVEIIGHEDM